MKAAPASIREHYCKAQPQRSVHSLWVWMHSGTVNPTVTFMACRCGCILEPPSVPMACGCVHGPMDSVLFWGLHPHSSFMALWTGMYSGTSIPRAAFTACGYRLILGPAAQLLSTRSVFSLVGGVGRQEGNVH